MQLKLFGQTLEYPNTNQALLDCFLMINEKVSENGDYVLTHFEIDGVEVFEDIYEYINERISTVERIEIKTTTYKKLLDDTIINLRDYLERALPEIKRLSDSFYNTSSKDSWARLIEFFDGLQWIIQAVKPIYTNNKEGIPYYKNSAEYESIINELVESVPELETAIRNQDLILIGDLLKYEFVTILDKLNSEANNTIDNEVVPNDLN